MKHGRRPGFVQRIVSGGQTGVDRGALDAAIELGIEHGGWCPRGRIAEDGRISTKYRLRETETSDYPARTELNVLNSDGTLILFRHRLVGGTDLTRRLAAKCGKPCLLVNLGKKADPSPVRQWIMENEIRVLNIAGPRESSCPGIRQAAFDFVCTLLTDQIQPPDSTSQTSRG
jgi:hypothetical protein